MRAHLNCMLIASSIVVSTASAERIAIENSSFEAPAFPVCAWGGTVPGWLNAGAWNPGTGDTCAPLNGFPGGVPDGNQVGYINSPSTPIKQVASATLQANATYTLLVDVGRRSDGFAMVHYAVRLVSNGAVLAQDPGIQSPPFGGFATSTVTFTVPPNHPSIGHPIEIHLLLLEGPQADFDNVRLYRDGTGATPGDLNGDGVVNGADLGALLGSWGACASCMSCPADFNGDCAVDAADLAVLLGSWT